MSLLQTECYVCPSPLSSYVKVLTLIVAVFGKRKWLRLNEVIRVGPRFNRISVFKRRDTSSLLLLLPSFPFPSLPLPSLPHFSNTQKVSTQGEGSLARH